MGTVKNTRAETHSDLLALFWCLFSLKPEESTGGHWRGLVPVVPLAIIDYHHRALFF